MHRGRRASFYVSLYSELWVGMMFGVQFRPLPDPVSWRGPCLKAAAACRVACSSGVSAVGHTIVLWNVERRQLCCRQLQVSSFPPFFSEALHIPCEETIFELSRRSHLFLVGTPRYSANTEHVRRLPFLFPLKKNWGTDHRGWSEIAPRRLLGDPSRYRLPLGSRLLSQWC